jgi:N-methylhydantoinase A
VPLAGTTPTRDDLQARFEAAYNARFRVDLPEIRANLMNINLSVIGRRPALDLTRLIDPAGRRATLVEARTGVRPVWFAGGWHETPVYWRDHLPLGAAFAGPAIVEQMDTTLVVPPGDRVATDAMGNLIVSVGAAA